MLSLAALWIRERDGAHLLGGALRESPRRTGARLISRVKGVNCTLDVCPETDT